jgi:hypothetical protein
VQADSLLCTKAILLVRGVIKRASDKSVICSRLRTIALMAFRPFRTCNNIRIVIFHFCILSLFFKLSHAVSLINICVYVTCRKKGKKAASVLLNFSAVDKLLKYLCRVHFTNNLGFPLASRSGEVNFVLTGSSKLGTSCNPALLLMADGD